MKTQTLLTLLSVGVIALTACDPDTRMSEKGFRLPDGDAAAGRIAFVELQCHHCHTIEGEPLPEVVGDEQPYIELGGDVTQVKTYGELVTAIINPSHKLAFSYAKSVTSEDGKSKMLIYNEHMTVQQLVDIVMFLQPTYDVTVPEYRYRAYPLRVTP